MNQTNFSVFNSPDAAAYYGAVSFISPCEKYLFDKYIPAGRDVLDLGVGGGRTTAYLAPQAARYVGVDYAEQMIRVCRAKFPTLEFRQADASDLSIFGPDGFDAVLMAFNGIDSLSDEQRRRCLQECFRVLRSGGFLIFSSHNIRAVLVAPAWNRHRVDDIAVRTSLGSDVLREFFRPLLACGAVARATVRAGWASAQRSGRLLTRTFWRGHGYMLDPAFGGFLQHCSVPHYVMAEVQGIGFESCEVQSSEYPAARNQFFDKWYYYVFRKP